MNSTSAKPDIRIAREELYEALWQIPMTKLAANWGVPVASIVKTAEMMNVPRPAPGHWQSVRLGFKVEPDFLPPAEASTVSSTDLAAPKKAAKTIARPAPPSKLPGIVIVDSVTDLNPKVRVLYSIMKDAPLIDSGPIKIEEKDNFHIWVSRAQMRRALFILDAIVKEVEKRGGSFVRREKFTEHLVAKFSFGAVTFQIAEQMNHKWMPTKREPLSEGGYFQYHAWRYFPTGRLSFSVLDYWPGGVRKHWRDGKRQRLEDCLPAIFDCLEQYAKLAAQQQEERDLKAAEYNRQCHEAYLRRSAPERLEKMLASFKERLSGQSRAWETARSVRAYLADCEAMMRSGGKELSLGGWQDRWLKWGHEWVNSFDPLTDTALEKLRNQFEELEALEAFVVELEQRQSGAPDIKAIRIVPPKT